MRMPARITNGQTGAGELFLHHAPLNRRCYTPAPATTRARQFEVASKPERDDVFASQIFCAAAVDAAAKCATGHRATCFIGRGGASDILSIIDAAFHASPAEHGSRIV